MDILTKGRSEGSLGIHKGMLSHDPFLLFCASAEKNMAAQNHELPKHGGTFTDDMPSPKNSEGEEVAPGEPTGQHLLSRPPLSHILRGIIL